MKKVILIISLFVIAALKLQAQSISTPSLLSLNKSVLTKDTVGYIPFTSNNISTISSAYYEQSVGYFCKLEWKTEKAIKIPLKFRLGSVQYVDHLEGKDK